MWRLRQSGKMRLFAPQEVHCDSHCDNHAGEGSGDSPAADTFHAVLPGAADDEPEMGISKLPLPLANGPVDGTGHGFEFAGTEGHEEAPMNLHGFDWVVVELASTREGYVSKNWGALTHGKTSW